MVPERRDEIAALGFKSMRSYFLIVWTFVCISLFLAGGCGNFYGEPRDKSRFISAELLEGDAVLFSYAHTVYRMAQGIAAFPDGGKAKYDADINVLGTYDLKTHETRIIKRDANRSWQADTGHYRIIQTRGAAALLIQGGQFTGSSDFGKQYWLIDVAAGTMQELALENELRQRGRAEGYMYMVHGDGTLLLICPSLDEKATHSQWSRDTGVVPELWVRYPGGEYHRIGASRHYEGVRGNAIIYWIAGTRQFMSYDLSTRELTALQGYKYPPFQDVTTGVGIDKDGRHLLLGHKLDGNWHYVTMALDPQRLME